MTSALPIITSLPSGGSEHGASKYFHKLACPKRAMLDEMKRAGENPLAFQSVYSMALVGVIGHRFYETYFRHQLPQDGPDIAFQIDEGVDEGALHDAERCFRVFRNLFPPTIFGKVLAVEEDIATDFFAPLPSTGRLDLLTKVSARDIEKIKAVFNTGTDKTLEMDGMVQDFVPGVWLWDWKHRSRRDGDLMDKAIESFSYAGYFKQVQSTFPKLTKDLRGTINVSIFVQKEPGFRLTVVPAPSSTQLEALKQAMTYAEALPTDLAIPTEANCFAWHKICPHLHNGCERM